jgi:hypothetical protein
MNLGYFPKPDSGIEARSAWAMPSTGFGENASAWWDVARTPDYSSIYESRRQAFYDEAVTKLKEYGLGDFPNPYLMVVPDFEHAMINGEGNPVMVDAVKRAAPKDYEPGRQFNPFPLRDAWSIALDQIIIEERKTHPDLPDPATFDQKIVEESAATRARAADLASRATFLGKVGGVAGGTAGTMSRDEEISMTLLTLPIGGVAGSLGRALLTRLLITAVTDGTLAGAQTGINEFAESKFQQQHFGYSKSGEEILGDMAYAAAASALFGVAVQGIGEGAGYLLSRWRSRHAAPQALGTAESGSALPFRDAASGPGSREEGGPVAVGLRSAAEQGQELYSVLSKSGRDAADIVDNKRQIATTGPAQDLTPHAQNVAQATEAVANGEQPIPIHLPGHNYFEIETTPDGHPVETQYEIVEADELVPLTLRQEMNAAAEQAEYEWMERVAAGWMPPAKGHNLPAAKGQAAHSVLKVWTKRKAKRDDRWRSEPRLYRPNGKYYKPDVLTPRDYIFELKSTTNGGKIEGERKGKSYRNELGKKVRIIYYDP